MKSTQLLPILSCALFSFVSGDEFTLEEIEFFENRIRPVLAQECYECHSTSGKKKGGLILDHREGLLIGGDQGPALVPGKASESLIIEALKHEFDLTMPKAGVKLDPPIIADFERWIDMGAPDPRDHPPTPEELARDTDWDAIFRTRQNWWSFQPVSNPEIPSGTGSAIDRFVETRMAEKDLAISAEATPRVLARRLHYAITGLPPSPEALDRFEQDVATSDVDAAMSKLVDDLLESPGFGERWARHWMDWVRYAESHGSEGDPPIPNAYHYRDYLIRALNQDIPYDQLLREHVAGDLLAKPRFDDETGLNESAIAAAHWRMVFHGFAPTDALDEKVRFTDDQINTFTKAFQGLTVSCARCHDHKFDAISQADYYALFGILGSTRPGIRLVDHPERLGKNRETLASLKSDIRRQIADLWMSRIDEATEKLLAPSPPAGAAKATSLFHAFHLVSEQSLLPGRAAERIIEAHRKAAGETTGEPVSEFRLTGGSDHESWFRYGNGVTRQPVHGGDFLLHPEGDKVVDRILPDGVYSGLLSTKHAGRFTSPDFKLEGEKKLALLVNGDGDSIARYVVQNYPRRGTVYRTYRFGEKKGKPEDWRWQVFDLSYWKGDTIHIELATARDTAILVSGQDRSWFGIREARLIGEDQPSPPQPDLEFLGSLVPLLQGANPATTGELASIYGEAIRTAIERWGRQEAMPSDSRLIDLALRSDLLPNHIDELPPALRDSLGEFRQREAEVPVPTRVPGIDEWAGIDQPLFDRGDHKKPLEPVSRRFIEAVDDEPYQSQYSGRLQLADDLLREDNPFTRRVIVNRVWTHLFGNGIVASVDNFGRLGEKPSHPELLDHLATRFSESMNWSLKSLIREIVLSRTWRQQSVASERARSVDPENRLLSHYPVRRLEAEAIRDKLIAVSGQLDDRMFGPAVDGNTPRRSVYVRVIRNRLDEFLGVFDAPIPFSTTGKRPVTNVPAQSLTMLNDPKVRGFAEAFARQFDGSDRERIAAMWERALDRKPSADEMTASLSFLETLRQETEALARQNRQIDEELATLIDENRQLYNRGRNSIIPPLEREKAIDPVKLGAMAS